MEALADAGADATAMVRVEARAADLPGAPRHVVASFDDPPPAEILRGFDRVVLLSPVHEEQAAMETVFIDALAVAGHRPHIGSSPGSGGLTLAGWLGAGSSDMVVIISGAADETEGRVASFRAQGAMCRCR